MTGKQDIAALSAALAAGIAIGLYIIGRLNGPFVSYAFASISFSTTIALIIRHIATNRRHISSLIAIYISLGILCALSSSIGSAGNASGTGILDRAASLTRASIMSIPFNSDSTAPLINALVTGDKSWLDRSLLTAFRESGASHILALSGLHLGISYGILLKITSVLGNSPRIRIVRSLAIVLFAVAYTLATGACPSLVRALLFIILNETSKLFHRESKPMQVFCAALMIQLILTPDALSSVGFQLSYLAMAGIIILYPKLKSWYPRDILADIQADTHYNTLSDTHPDGLSQINPDLSDEQFYQQKETSTGSRIKIPPRKKSRTGPFNRLNVCSKLADNLNIPRKIWDAAALTISCQIFTGPLAWLTFGTFPKYFLLTNILALPVTGILMTLAFISVILHIAGICPQIILSATDYAASALIFIMNTISTM